VLINDWIKLYNFIDLANSFNDYRIIRGNTRHSFILSYKLCETLKPSVNYSYRSYGFNPFVNYFQRRHIPKLVFDGIWKKKGVIGIDSFLKVKREKGEDRAEGVQGLVGIKDKLELNPSRWILSNTIVDIIRHDYLVLFRIYEHIGNKIITFPIIYPLPPPDDNNLYENNRYN
jgi:hypothetical protein